MLSAGGSGAQTGVLIETYWNVKVLSAGGSGAQTGY